MVYGLSFGSAASIICLVWEWEVQVDAKKRSNLANSFPSTIAYSLLILDRVVVLFGNECALFSLRRRDRPAGSTVATYSLRDYESLNFLSKH